MLERSIPFTRTTEKTIEKLVQKDALHLIHMVFPQGEGLPVHTSNAPLHMIVLQGTLSIRLNEDEERRHPAGQVVAIPEGVVMDVTNRDRDTLELFVIKAPGPGANKS